MNKIKMIADRETNYIYHMLSVAKCGYNNDYGAKYRGDYLEEDLVRLKKHESLITCAGGSHWGELYTLMLCYPAAQWTGDAKSFYREIINQADSGDVPEQYLALAPAAREIADVMVRSYDHYINDIWPEDRKLLEDYIARVMPLFEQSDFTDRAETVVGCKLSVEAFHPSMVTSIQHGAEAIDISETTDIFGISRSPEDSFLFIGHEFIIYLLKQALREEDAFKRFETWEPTEALAEYYLKKLTGNTLFGGVQKWIDLYCQYSEYGEQSAAGLYRTALAKNNL